MEYAKSRRKTLCAAIQRGSARMSELKTNGCGEKTTDALDLTGVKRRDCPYGTNAIAEIRPAAPEDYPAIVAMGQAADMGTLEGFEHTLVATDERGTVVAFCRIRIYDGIAHVNPIVVDESLRGRGVGAALMHEARKRFGELRFVARGHAVGFYTFIGCEPIEWSDVARDVAADCDECDQVQQCKPLPMRFPEA